MYRRETKEKAAYAGNRTRRTDSVKQHEMAALREMEQMVLAAENSEGTAGLEKAVAHLESFLQQVRKTRILDEKQRAMEAFRGKFEDGYTWRNGFLRNVARFGSRRALADLESGRVWNYTQLNAEANRFAHGLLRAGLRKGDVVMVQLHNCPEFVFAYLACHKTGMVFCPVNFRLSAKEIADCMDNSHPKVFLSEPEVQAEVDLALTRTGSAPQILLTTEETAPHSYTGFVADCPTDDPALSWELSIYDETLRLFTSGTTGRQKSVCLTSINEVLSAHDVMIHFPFSFADVSMNTTPWFHRGGLHSGGITPTLYAGGTVVIQRKFQAAQTLDAVEKYGLTFIIGVPNVLELLAEEQQNHPRDLSSLHGIVTMGSPLERADCIRYQKILTQRIFNGYGTTETFWNTFLRPDDLPEKRLLQIEDMQRHPQGTARSLKPRDGIVLRRGFFLEGMEGNHLSRIFTLQGRHRIQAVRPAAYGYGYGHKEILFREWSARDMIPHSRGLPRTFYPPRLSRDSQIHDVRFL